MVASKLGLLLWFRLLEGDLGGGGNGQHVDHALGPCNNVGTVVLLARDVAALLPVGNLFCTYSLKFYILEQKIRTFVKQFHFCLLYFDETLKLSKSKGIDM